MIAMLKSLRRDESGQDLIEYALIAALIAVAMIATLNAVAGGITAELDKVTNALK